MPGFFDDPPVTDNVLPPQEGVVGPNMPSTGAFGGGGMVGGAGAPGGLSFAPYPYQFNPNLPGGGSLGGYAGMPGGPVSPGAGNPNDPNTIKQWVMQTGLANGADPSAQNDPDYWVRVIQQHGGLTSENAGYFGDRILHGSNSAFGGGGMGSSYTPIAPFQMGAPATATHVSAPGVSAGSPFSYTGPALQTPAPFQGSTIHSAQNFSFPGVYQPPANATPPPAAAPTQAAPLAQWAAAPSAPAPAAHPAGAPTGDEGSPFPQGGVHLPNGAWIPLDNPLAQQELTRRQQEAAPAARPEDAAPAVQPNQAALQTADTGGIKSPAAPPSAVPADTGGIKAPTVPADTGGIKAPPQDVTGAYGPQGAFVAPTMAEAVNDPGYQFTLNQGLQALQNSAAGRGSYFTPNLRQGLIDYGQNAAAQQYQNVYNRSLASYGANQGANAQAFNQALTANQTNFQNQFQVEQANQQNALAGYGLNAQTQLGYQGQQFQQQFAPWQVQSGNELQASQANANNSLQAAALNQQAQQQAWQDNYQAAWNAYQSQVQQQQFGAGLGLQSAGLGLQAQNQNFNQGLQTYQTNAGQYNLGQNNMYNWNMGLAQFGLGATNSMNQGGENYANNAGNLYTGMGNATAAGQVGSANAWNNFYGSLGNLANQGLGYYATQPHPATGGLPPVQTGLPNMPGTFVPGWGAQ